MLKNIRIVLVRTFHPGNIGSVARAMKTMGLTDLALVDPVDFPAEDALKMAASADDVLDNAQVFDSLYDAVKDCQLVIASTARSRAYELPQLSPEQAAGQLLSLIHAQTTKSMEAKQKPAQVALVFGPERMGLSNDDLTLAHYRVSIPTHPDYASLNLAAAVQILSYEVYKQSLEFLLDESAEIDIEPEQFTESLPSIEDRELLYAHLEQTFSDTGFIIKNHPGEVMNKFRHLFDRAKMTREELNILRGALASVQRDNSTKR